MVDSVIEIKENFPVIHYFKEAIKILPYSCCLDIDTSYTYARKALSLNELIKTFYYDINTEINPHGKYSRCFGYFGENKKDLRINIKGNGLNPSLYSKKLFRKTQFNSNINNSIFNSYSKTISERELNFEKSLFFYKKNKDLIGDIVKENSSLIYTRFFPDKNRKLFHSSFCYLFENLQPKENIPGISDDLYNCLNLKEFSELEKKSKCNYKAFRDIYGLDVLTGNSYFFDELDSKKLKEEIEQNKINIFTILNGSIENKDLTDFIIKRGVSKEHKNIYLGIIFKRIKPALNRLVENQEFEKLDKIVEEYNKIGKQKNWELLKTKNFIKIMKEI